MKKEKPTLDYSIEQEADKVWVNGKYNCLGRFTKLGFEVYRNMGVTTDVIGTTNTLAVRVLNTDEKQWNNFKTLMKEHHGIDLDENDVAYPKPE